MLNLGVTDGLVIYGQDSLDEISMSAPTSVCEFHSDMALRRYVIAPEDFGFTRCTKADIAGGTPADNAAVTLDILKGGQGAKTDIVLINAAAAIYISGKVASIEEGLNVAREMVSSGKALNKLEAVKIKSHES